MAQQRMDDFYFNCPEKFSRENAKQCTMKGIYFLEVADADISDGSASEDDMTISMCAITGVRSSTTLQLTMVVCGAALNALVDSSSTHCFIDTAAASRLGLIPEAWPGLTAGVANGDRVSSASICKDITITVDQEEFNVDLYVITLTGYELVLGCAWPRTLGLILWDFERQTTAF